MQDTLHFQNILSGLEDFWVAQVYNILQFGFSSLKAIIKVMLGEVRVKNDEEGW